MTKRFLIGVATMFIAAWGMTWAAQAGSSGTYSGWFGWHSYGSVTSLGGDDATWAGGFDGAFRNDAGSGIFHNASVVCPSAAAFIAGMEYYQGNCVMRDADGDEAALTWICQSPTGARCDGTLSFVGGTGKYVGITGDGTFNGGPIGATPQGYSTWEGAYSIP